MERDLIDRAIRGDTEAARALVDRLTPVVQARVVRALRRRAGDARGRNIQQEVEDMVQEVFLSLFDHAGKALRRWEPDKGLSLENFVGLVAERQVASIMRSGRRSPWKEDPTEGETLSSVTTSSRPADAQVASRELLEMLLDRLREELSPRGLQLFYALLVHERSVTDVCAETGLSRDAVYQWRSRLGKLVKRLGDEISNLPASDRGRTGTA
ncbi:RNA polymerase sigma factor [Haliangium sp.]|uniref:RNA polymerase sigma factor n=1 Tax=Haliangium sp. TaxID=2663208 RepID=UPI003D11354A